MERLNHLKITTWAMVASYFLIAMFVMPLSDRIVLWVVTDSSLIARLDFYKEMVFVTVSSSLLYYLLHRNNSTLQASELRSRRLLDSIPNPAFLMDKEKRILALNYAGRTFGARVGDYCWCAIHGMLELSEQDRNSFLMNNKPLPGTSCSGCRADQVLDSRRACSEEQEIDGRIWQVWWLPVDNETYLHYLVDITIIRKNEQALRENELRYRDLFNGMTEGFALHEIIYEGDKPVDYRFLDVNPAFERLTGLNTDTLIGNTVRQVLPDIETAWIDRYAHVAAGGKPVRFEDYSKSLEKYFDVSVYCPAPGRFACIFSDITSVRTLEEHLRQAQKMESIGMLAGGVAHDFNNILTVILGGCALLEMPLTDDSERAQYVDQIRDAAERAASLTQSLLTFSRKQPISLGSVDISRLVDEMSAFIKRLVGESILLRTDLCPEPTIVSADRHQLEQVLVNLVANARDAMSHDGTLTVSTEVVSASVIPEFDCVGDDKYVVMRVRDTGCGMDAASMKKVFEPFYTTKEMGRGTGLGLSMAYGIVRQHNGLITVSSTEGAGTVFTVYLPCYPGDDRNVGPGDGNPSPVGNEQLLLVEDDPDVMKTNRLILAQRGFRVISASQGEEAVELYRQYHSQIALVVLDVVMPRMNGKQVYERLKLINPDVKVLFMSGYTADILWKHNVVIGDIAFIPKPVEPARLFNRIRSLIDA